MSIPRDSLPAADSTLTTLRDQSTQTQSEPVGSPVDLPTPDRPHLPEPPRPQGNPPLASSPATWARFPVPQPAPAGPDQTPLRSQDGTHIAGQGETIPSAHTGRGSQDTITRPSTGTLAAQDNPVKPTPSPAPSISKQVQTSPPPSLDGHGALIPEVNTGPHISTPTEIRRNAPLPPLPQAFMNPAMPPPSINYPWINPAYNRRLNNVGGATRPGNFDRTSGMMAVPLAGVPSHNYVTPDNPTTVSPRTTTAPLTSGHGFEKSGHGMEEIILPVPDAVPNQGYTNVSRSRTLRSRDWMMEVEEKERSVGLRLDPTLEKARFEREKFALRAKVTAYALNIAIGLQVLIGALTTGLSAASPGKQTSIATAILGGIATLIASYLARARGSQEPELSAGKVKDLDQFIRDCETFLLDHGTSIGSTKPNQEDRLHELRERFEKLLGHGKGDRLPAQALRPPA